MDSTCLIKPLLAVIVQSLKEEIPALRDAFLVDFLVGLSLQGKRGACGIRERYNGSRYKRRAWHSPAGGSLRE